MKLLFLSPYLPSPPRWGAPRRVHGLLSELARRHEVSVLAFTVPSEDAVTGIRATSQYCTEVVTVESTRLDRALDRKKKRAIQLRSLLHTKSFERLTFFHPAFQQKLDEMTENGNYDVITIEHAQMACYRLPRASGSPTGSLFVLDEHNIEYDILRRTTAAEQARFAPSIRKLYNWVNYLKLRSEERAAWEQFDGISLTSERDEQLLRLDAPEARTAVIPNAVDTEFFRPSGGAVEPGMILFFGAINYYPNTDGLSFFLDEVFPQIKQQHEDARLWIVGQSPPPAITSRASEDVIVTGLVDDLLPYLERAAVVIAPLRIGGGTRLKIVEAMAMAKAIVATRIGAEGLDVNDDLDILLGDTAEEFARHVVRVLGDAGLASRLGKAARQSAESRYTWKSAVDRLERFYQELPSPAHAAGQPAQRLSHGQGDVP